MLGVLATRPCHGYELKTEFERLTGGLWELNIGQVYSTLDRLQKDGLVELATAPSSQGTPPGGADDRKVYRITATGVAELDVWLGEPPLKPRPVRDEIFVRLALLLSRQPAAAMNLIDGQRRIYHLQMADLTRQKLALGRSQPPDRLHRELMLDAAILHCEADLKWLEICEDKLQAHEGGGKL